MAKPWTKGTRKGKGAKVDQLPGKKARPGKGGQKKKAKPVSPSSIPNGPASSRPSPSGRTYGNPPAKKLAKKARKALADGIPEVAMMMRDADPELRALWAEQLSDGSREVAIPEGKARRLEKSERQWLLDKGVPELDVKTMSRGDVDVELRDRWLRDLGLKPQPAPESSAPPTMDPDRYKLHTQAKTLARARCDADPRLDPAEEYASTCIRLLDRGNEGVI